MKFYSSPNMNHSRLFVMVGCPGSGKSYVCKHNNYLSTLPYISRDVVRFSIIGDNDSYFSQENQVFMAYVQQLVSELNVGHDVIADATHINAGSRNKLIRAIRQQTKATFEIVYLVMYTDLNTCVARNSTRKGRACVPEDVIHKMFKIFTCPTLDEDPAISTIWCIYPDNSINLIARRPE